MCASLPTRSVYVPTRSLPFCVRVSFHVRTTCSVSTTCATFAIASSYNFENPDQFMNYVRIRCRDFDHGLDPFDILLHMNLLSAIIDFISLYFAIARIKYYSTVITLYKDLESNMLTLLILKNPHILTHLIMRSMHECVCPYPATSHHEKYARRPEVSVLQEMIEE